MNTDRPLVSLLNGVSFNSYDDESLLSSAHNQNISLEYSCKTGRCGACKAKVLSGKTELIQEESYLDTEESSAGYILTCCRLAVTNVELNIESISGFTKVEPKTVPCRIDAIEYLSSDVIQVFLRFPPSIKPKYYAGQYADIIGKDGLRRSYSIANLVDDSQRLEFHIKKVANGKMSFYWFEEAKVNDLLRVELPLGTFFLRPSQKQSLILMATGTGIAPIKAILEDLVISPEKNLYRDIHIYWGGRKSSDIYWNPKMIIHSLKSSRFIPVLSRGDKSWSGDCGYIQDIVINDGINLFEADVYACGSASMIKSAKTKFVESGLPEHNFYSDAFVSSS